MELIDNVKTILRDDLAKEIGRIFIDPVHYRKGYGISLMKLAETFYPGVKKIKLDTPLWNVRTNVFYTKLGYREVRRDDEFAYYQKELH